MGHVKEVHESSSYSILWSTLHYSSIPAALACGEHLQESPSTSAMPGFRIQVPPDQHPFNVSTLPAVGSRVCTALLPRSDQYIDAMIFAMGHMSFHADTCFLNSSSTQMPRYLPHGICDSLPIHDP